ncbi:MAG: hypothetical protein EU530_00655 [Promethearchaeota archaeon]|nr:MAG: hypothetical protein EU530_00655 [Candidatus Lokiarchaeota archaeon]
MITWILAIFLFLWILAERIIKKKKIVGVPLGLPEGTVRACIALLIVSFPLNQFIMNSLISSPLSIQKWFMNTLFVVVAFYFEARAFEKTIPQLLKEIKDPAKYKKTRNELPVYWPRFTVRIILFTLLILTVVLLTTGVFTEPTSLVPQIPITDTITELIFIVFFFMVGLIIRRIHQKSLTRKIRRQLKTHDGTQEELIEILEKKERRNGRITEGILAFVMLITLIIVLIFYTLPWNLDLFIIPIIDLTVSIRMGMILLLSLYFGYRQ